MNEVRLLKNFCSGSLLGNNNGLSKSCKKLREEGFFRLTKDYVCVVEKSCIDTYNLLVKHLKIAVPTLIITRVFLDVFNIPKMDLPSKSLLLFFYITDIFSSPGILDLSSLSKNLVLLLIDSLPVSNIILKFIISMMIPVLVTIKIIDVFHYASTAKLDNEDRLLNRFFSPKNSSHSLVVIANIINKSQKIFNSGLPLSFNGIQTKLLGFK